MIENAEQARARLVPKHFQDYTAALLAEVDRVAGISRSTCWTFHAGGGYTSPMVAAGVALRLQETGFYLRPGNDELGGVQLEIYWGPPPKLHALFWKLSGWVFPESYS